MGTKGSIFFFAHLWVVHECFFNFCWETHVQSTLALRTARYHGRRYYGQNPDPGKSYRGLTGNDFRYYGIADFFLVPK